MDTVSNTCSLRPPLQVCTVHQKVDHKPGGADALIVPNYKAIDIVVRIISAFAVRMSRCPVMPRIAVGRFGTGPSGHCSKAR